MQTTLVGQQRSSNCQEMGETREPMASDCWDDAQRFAHMYSMHVGHDFWVLYAAKPHTKMRNAVVAGWEVSLVKPPAAMVGALVFKWVYEDQALIPEPDLCLPYDVPLSECELSDKAKDFVPSVAKAGEKSGVILLA